jgi:hypothetical protein
MRAFGIAARKEHGQLVREKLALHLAARFGPVLEFPARKTLITRNEMHVIRLLRSSLCESRTHFTR